MKVTDKKAMIADIAGEVLDAMYYGIITAPQDLYQEGSYCDVYTEDGQDRFNALHDIVEAWVDRYVKETD